MIPPAALAPAIAVESAHEFVPAQTIALAAVPAAEGSTLLAGVDELLNGLDELKFDD